MRIHGYLLSAALLAVIALALPGVLHAQSVAKDGAGKKDDAKALARGCCSCVEKLELKLVGRHTKRAAKWTMADSLTGESWEVVGQDAYGHELKVFIHYRNKRIDTPGEQPGDLVLKWLEKSDRPPENNVAAGVKPKTWANIPEVLGGYEKTEAVLTKGTFGPWTRHDKTCPLPITGVKTPAKIEITDLPRIRKGRSRTMDFDITVESTPNCRCTHKALQVTAQQVLETDSKNKNTKFYAPPGTALKTGSIVRGTSP